MAGMFELFIDADASFRFQLTAPDGTVMAVSRAFPDKAAAVEGIAAVREYAGMGHVTELSAAPADRQPPRRPAAVPAGGSGAGFRRGLPARPEVRQACTVSAPVRSLVSSSSGQPPGVK
jgi:uncharacterized protein YegP (UPF0339 family)